jgi:hypothetical protein
MDTSVRKNIAARGAASARTGAPGDDSGLSRVATEGS